jgi:hypothetical protein
MNLIRCAAVLLLAMAAGQGAPAQERTEVQFEAGKDNAYVQGTITGRDFHDYTLTCSAGQTMAVSLIPQGGVQPSFDILPPGSSGGAIFDGSGGGSDATVTLPEDGAYVIRVYLPGDAQGSGGTADYGLSMTIL